MTAAFASHDVEQLLYRAAARATLAPSIHNTQPWRFVVGAGRLDLYADPGRGLAVVDPSGRQLTISCGAALAGVRLALAAAGLATEVVLLPDVSQPDLLASTTALAEPLRPVGQARRLDAAAGSRHSNRRGFGSEPVSDQVIETLQRAIVGDGAWLRPLTEEADRAIVAVLTRRADGLQDANAAYRSELRAWTTGDPRRTDGVPSTGVPRTTGVPSVTVPRTTGQARDDVPLRDFDPDGVGELPPETRSSSGQTLLVIGTAGDTIEDWLIAGQALYRVLLALTSTGYAASVLSQVFEVPATRRRMRDGLRLAGEPHILIRAGAAAPTAPTPRRPLAEVIVHRPGPAR